MTSPLLPSPFIYGDIPGGGNLATIVVAQSAPTTAQNQQAAGTFWLVPEPGSGNLYYLAGFNGGVPQWELISSSSGTIIAVNGTTSQITASTSSGVVTLTIPSAFIAPGSIQSTTSITAGNGFTATLGNITASAGNIVATLGNITASAGSVSAATTVTAGTGVTATTGNVTATNGNIVRGTAGNKDVYSSVATDGTAGANSAGTATLVGGTITINTTAVTASSIIRLYRQGVGSTGAAALGILTVGTVVAATSFDINSVQAADATALQASDVSVVAWEIVN